jgi:hypothetical protein
VNTQLARLTAKVKAVNQANKYAKTLHATLTSKFRPLVGHTIRKSNGSLLQRYADLIPILPNRPTFRAYYLSLDSRLVWSVHASVSVGDELGSYTTEVCVGRLNGKFLCALTPDPPDRRDDYTVNEIVKLCTGCRAAEAAYNMARAALQPFDMDDA